MRPIASAVILVDIAPRVNHAGTAVIHNFMHSAPHGFASLEEAADAIAAYLPHRPRPTDNSGLLKNLRLRSDGRYYWHWDPMLVQLAPESIADGYERMAAAARNITVPTLLVRGGKSELLTDESVEDFMVLQPTAEYQVIHGAHHMVAGDRNTAFSAAVVEFMQRRVNHGAPGHFD